jgi:hypothetical protein
MAVRSALLKSLFVSGGGQRGNKIAAGSISFQ